MPLIMTVNSVTRGGVFTDDALDAYLEAITY